MTYHEGKEQPEEISEINAIDEDLPQGSSRNSEVAAHIDALPERSRKPVRLQWVEGLSYPEAPRQLHQAIGAVKSYINRDVERHLILWSYASLSLHFFKLSL